MKDGLFELIEWLVDEEGDLGEDPETPEDKGKLQAIQRTLKKARSIQIENSGALSGMPPPKPST